jgi:error-prone DNA polymerase
MVEARAAGCFRSVEHLAAKAKLPPHALRRLAEADAFASLGLSRRAALWDAMKCDGLDTPLAHESSEPAVALPEMPLTEEVAADYQTAGLSLKRHPVALIRRQLSEMGIIASAELGKTAEGTWVEVAGLVLVRQRPGTASGIVFATLEDETGQANLIVRPDVFERYRPAAAGAVLLRASGRLQREGKVIHVIAQRMEDIGYLLRGHSSRSRDFR